MTEKIRQGPYNSHPPFPPPELKVREKEGGALRQTLTGRWQQVNDGTWWAFYNSPGPTDKFWCEQYPDDPNWWRIPKTIAVTEYADRWACRHGEVYQQDNLYSYCDGTCGYPGSYQPVTPEQIEQAKRDLARTLKEYS